MKTSNPFPFAALKMRSMFSTVLFSVTLSPTAPHARPLSLKTSFCGSMKTTAVSSLFISIDSSHSLTFALTGFQSEQKFASLVLDGFECWPPESVRQFLLLQELFDPAGDLFPVRPERKMTRVE